MSITVRNIRKSFNDFQALNGVSLDLPSGELVALLGPSGCGKTTLLRIIAGLESADEGTVLLGGSDATSLHVRQRQVGFVFQHYALFRHMTVFENIAFGLRVRPRGQRPSPKDIRDRVKQLLGLVQLDWLADRFPSQLSGGQRQRVALARALAVEPRVLLLDEPFGALDAKVRKELRRWLRRLHDELHITSVFVTHDQEEALEVADKIVLMNRGSVEQICMPREIYEQPATAFAFGFIGTVNEFAGQVEGSHLRIGDDVIPHGGISLRDGGQIVGFARPQDLVIVPGGESGQGIKATVNRVLDTGPLARVELLRNYTNGSGRAEYYEAEMSHKDVAELGIRNGQQVRVLASRLKLFDEDQRQRPSAK